MTLNCNKSCFFSTLDVRKAKWIHTSEDHVKNVKSHTYPINLSSELRHKYFGILAVLVRVS